MFGAAAIVLIRMNMAAIDQRARAMTSFAESRGLGFTSSDAFELSALPFEIVGVRGAVAVTNLLYGGLGGLQVIGFDMRHQVAVGQDSILRFSCALTTLDVQAPPMVIARRTVGRHRVGAVVGGATDVITESAQFDRVFAVRCDDRRFALAVLEPAMIAWLLDARGDWSFELAGSRLLCYAPQRRIRELDSLFGALREFRERLPAALRDHAPAAAPDELLTRVEMLVLPRAHRPMRVSSVWITVTLGAIVVIGMVALAVLAVLLAQLRAPL